MLFASTGLTGRGAAILSTPSYHAAVRPDGHAFKSNRWEECVQMPTKVARSAPRPPFGLPELTVAVRTSLLSCRKAGKTRVFTPVRESSGESRLGRFDMRWNTLLAASVILLSATTSFAEIPNGRIRIGVL